MDSCFRWHASGKRALPECSKANPAVRGGRSRKIFFSFAPHDRHNRCMPTTTGACLNAIGILLGALIGLARETPFSLRTQLLFRNGIGAFNFFFGVRLMYLSISGSFLHCLKEIFTAVLAVVLGFWMGKLF